MLDGLSLNNFQSHKETNIQFHPGVNAIIGESDSGKSALMRAMYWVIQNRPAGMSVVSHWNRKKSGEPKDPTSVDLGIDGESSITRVRQGDSNSYQLWTADGPPGMPDTQLDAVRTDVPDTVSRRLNLGPVNVQKQLDPPFLLSASNGEVARFLNGILRLDIIDQTLSRAESLRRQLNASAEASRGTMARLEGQIADLNWISQARELIDQASRVEARMAKTAAECDSIQQALREWDQLEAQKEQAEVWIQLASKLQELTTAQLAVIKAEAQATTMEEQITDFSRAGERIALHAPWLTYEAKMRQLEAAQQEVAKLDAGIELDVERIAAWVESLNIADEKWLLAEPKLVMLKDIMFMTIGAGTGFVSRLEGFIQDYKEHEAEVDQWNSDIEVAEAELPEICPTCGGLGRIAHGHPITKVEGA